MSAYRFSVIERFAVWHTYSSLCFWCGRPLLFFDTTIDHVIAEHLGAKPEEFGKLKEAYALSDDFTVNDYRNWVPACASCNTKKGQLTYTPSPVFLGAIEKARRHGDKARREAEKLTRDARKDKMLARIEIALESNTISEEDLKELLKGLEAREPVLSGPLQPLEFSETLSILPKEHGDEVVARIIRDIAKNPAFLKLQDQKRKADEQGLAIQQVLQCVREMISGNQVVPLLESLGRAANRPDQPELSSQSHSEIPRGSEAYVVGVPGIRFNVGSVDLFPLLMLQCVVKWEVNDQRFVVECATAAERPRSKIDASPRKSWPVVVFAGLDQDARSDLRRVIDDAMIWLWHYVDASNAS